ncbi:MAG: YbbR-like domain-containing protein [Candidatus Omnitrophica bacterium]|nr:YbbR-like domain-containing protein [Candidatus Omnitrophota bacterium]MDD5487429.1 YbbR-like domain-containing protein [Candidatus Omnitrophota bacterium]
MNLYKVIFNNVWAKLIALVLAIATWFYVFDLVNSDSFLQKSDDAEEAFFRNKFTMKELQIKPVFYGKSPDGYRVIFDKVVLDPSELAVFGPDNVLAGITELRTQKIDLNEYTRSTRLRVGIDADSGLLKLEDKVIDVYLPVESVSGKRAVTEKIAVPETIPSQSSPEQPVPAEGATSG